MLLYVGELESLDSSVWLDEEHDAEVEGEAAEVEGEVVAQVEVAAEVEVGKATSRTSDASTSREVKLKQEMNVDRVGEEGQAANGEGGPLAQTRQKVRWTELLEHIAVSSVQ